MLTPSPHRLYKMLTAVVVFFISLTLAGSVSVGYAQTGHVMNGVGPIDQAMGGAGMAAPQDALTALHWNPASLFAVPGTSFDLGIQLMMPTGSISSSVQANAFGPPFGPPATLQGTTDSEAGPFPIPAIGFTFVKPDSRFAFGLSAFGVGGFGVDYALSSSNPILTPQMPNGGMGFGAMNSTFMLLQVSPTMAYKLNENLWVGFAPTFNMASLELSVFPATAPQFIDAFGTPSVPQDDLPLYPDAPATWAAGYGFQVGVHAQMDDLSLGISYKSPQKFQDFEYEPETAGAPDYTFEMDFPMIVSGAVAYTGVENLLLAADVRYIDYANTAGFDKTGFDSNFAVQGFGWDAVTVVALGAQIEVSEQFPVRIGYAWNSNPISDDVAFFNSPAPALVMHHVSGGFSYLVKDGISISFAGQYGFKNSVKGVWKSPMFPGGENPGTSVEHELSTLTLIAGMHLSF
jgi:long-chain fatty acid transport protein